MVWARSAAEELSHALKRRGESRLSVERLSDGRLSIFDARNGSEIWFKHLNKTASTEEEIAATAERLVEWAAKHRQ